MNANADTGMKMDRRRFLLAAGGSAAALPASLKGMAAGKVKISGCRIYAIAIDGRYPVIVELLTDQGVTGIGDAAVAYGTGAKAAAAMIQELYQQFVAGRDPFAVEAIWSDMYDHTFWAKGGGTIIFAGMGAIEQALLDIKGKCLGVPVYELLGGRMRDQVRVYANGWSFRCTEPADFARAAEKVVQDGYTALKFYPLATAELDAQGHIRHVSHRSIDSAAERKALASVKAVRDAIGGKIDLFLDMSAELTTDAIIRLGRKLEDLDIGFFEEPVDPSDVEALKKVSEQVHLPIAVGERLYTRYGFRRIMELHAADILQPDVGNTGGILEAKKIAAMAETYNMRIQPHNCSSPVCTAASVQLDASISNFYIQELYPYRIPEHFAIVDRPLEREVRNSLMPVPDRPGLGVNLVAERVRPFLWAQI
jgi:galactonate dehydratase